VVIDIESKEAPKNENREIEVDAVNGGDTLLTVHRIASRLFQSGAFDKATMRQFDELCLTPIKQMGAGDIRELREVTGVSQAVLARILNVTASTVGQWERGEKRPTGSALKLLSLMQSKGVGTVL
jgi:putative transcriptional regulator